MLPLNVRFLSSLLFVITFGRDSYNLSDLAALLELRKCCFVFSLLGKS